MAVPQRVDGWTFADLADLPEDARHRYEVVDGLLVVSPRPVLRHERVAHHLARQVEAGLPLGWECWREVGVALGTDGRVADLGVVASVPRFSADEDVAVDPRDLAMVLEVVSASSRKTDRFFKPLEYAEAGIGTYWRVETEPEVVVHVHELVGDAYRQVHEVRGRARVDVPFPLELDVPALTAPSGDRPCLACPTSRPTPDQRSSPWTSTRHVPPSS